MHLDVATIEGTEFHNEIMRTKKDKIGIAFMLKISRVSC